MITNQDLLTIREVIRDVIREELNRSEASDGWLTIDEICRQTGRSKPTIYRWEKSGYIQSHVRGKQRMYKFK